MHISSFEKMRSFVATYTRFARPPAGGRVRLLEIGSRSYDGQRSYRDLLDPEQFDYTGLDLLPGSNVDIVAGGYVFPEVQTASFDVVISGQTFEHNPFFWVTMAEIARVLRPGGYLCVIAPGAGLVHRYPLDCWRFYPDSWSALAALVGLELVESYLETDEMALAVQDGHLRDSMAIMRRPDASSPLITTRLAQLTEPFRSEAPRVEAVQLPEGPCVSHYREHAPRRRGWRDRLARRLSPFVPSRVWSEQERQG